MSNLKIAITKPNALQNLSSPVRILGLAFMDNINIDALDQKKYTREQLLAPRRHYERAFLRKRNGSRYSEAVFLYKNAANQKAHRDVVRVFLQDLPANAVKSRVSDSQYTVLTLKLNIFLLSKCFDYKKSRHFLFYRTGFIAPY